MIISNLNSINYASFTFAQISYLKNTKTKNWDFNAIVQFYILYSFFLLYMLCLTITNFIKRWKYGLAAKTEKTPSYAKCLKSRRILHVGYRLY